nr:hypothetical protein [uncultured Kingella sp.]
MNAVLVIKVIFYVYDYPKNHARLKINRLTQPENEEVVNLHADEILFYVEDGVNGIYEQFQRRFYIAEISFYPSDSPPASWYAGLTFMLLEFVMQQETKAS